MKTIINGIEVSLPKKLESRMDEVTELVNMVLAALPAAEGGSF